MSFDPPVSPLSPAHHKAAEHPHSVYLALGSNLADRRGNLEAALQRLRAYMEITRVSSIYETEPVGYSEQPRFLNMACLGKTELPPQALLQRLQEIEVSLGRQATFRNGPRLIDIDIVFYDELIINEDDLTVPHPRMAQRAFVLVPLSEIAPEVMDPLSGQTVRQLLQGVSQAGVQRIAPGPEPGRIPLDSNM